MKKILFIFFLFFSVVPTLFSQNEVAVDTTQADQEYEGEVTTDEVEEKEMEFKQPVVRVVPADSVEALKKQPGFAYMSFIDSFYKNKKKLPPPVAEAEEPASPGIFDFAGFRMLYWGLAFAAVIFLLWKLFLGSNALFASNKKLQAEIPETIEDDISNNHMDQLIEKAIRAKDYRLAIRYLYLQVLTLLGEKELLLLAPQKTNYQYVRELDGKPLQPAFSALTMQYEYAWFGNFAVENTQFNSIHNGFKKFREQVG